MNDDIKPCPFCGGSAEVDRMGSGRQSMIIACATCGCRLESSDTFLGPHCSWNTRAPVRVKLHGATWFIDETMAAALKAAGVVVDD